MKKSQQPAKRSYFFGKGYRDVGCTIRDAWIHNFNSIRDYGFKLGNLSGETATKKILFGVVYVLAIIAVVVFGTLITAAISLINIAVVAAFMIVIYIGFTVIWVVDRLYLVRNRIFTACHECKEKSLIPTYICPRCGAKHTNLTPGVYGILKRTCNCGEKLPTTFFNGRKNLDAECPVCGQRLNDRESRPICIPVVGGRSVGKTAFITAFSREFVEHVAPEKGMEIEFYNDRKEAIYGEIMQDFSAGSTRMTVRPQDIHEASSVSFSFFVKHPKLSPERLIHVYDIAGEVFTDNNENEIQKQYEYCQGIIFIIDPFAIPSVRNRYEEMLTPEDLAGIGKADINEIIDAFLNKLREVTGLSENRMNTVPLAVVISKIDSGNLEDEIGIAAVNRAMAENPEKFADFFDTEDYLCRQFLKDNYMEGFLSNINNTFKKNRFFSCSAIGHTRDHGEYRPVGVLPPMEWLFRNADAKMGEIWNDVTFSAKTISMEE